MSPIDRGAMRAYNQFIEAADGSMLVAWEIWALERHDLLTLLPPSIGLDAYVHAVNLAFVEHKGESNVG